MIFYKILAMFLIGSPITILTPHIFFPYSYLGLVLFFLADWFSYKPFFPIINCLFLCFCTLAMVIHKPMSYQLMISIFVIVQYINFSITIPKLNSIFYIGMFLSLISMFNPIVFLFNTFLLGFTLSIYYIIKRKKTLKSSKKTENKTFDLEETDNDIDQLNEQIIPTEMLQNQELDYVIPISTDE